MANPPRGTGLASRWHDELSLIRLSIDYVHWLNHQFVPRATAGMRKYEMLLHEVLLSLRQLESSQT